MELPTYTNIWKIEKRLYKLYDFRLPMPLPIGQVTVFLAIAVPYMLILTLVGMPFSHTWVWLYALPPGVLAWLVTRPVLEGKRLPELVLSQLRYLAEPQIWCRMTPAAEKDRVIVIAQVWRAPVSLARHESPAEPESVAAPQNAMTAHSAVAPDEAATAEEGVEPQDAVAPQNAAARANAVAAQSAALQMGPGRPVWPDRPAVSWPSRVQATNAAADGAVPGRAADWWPDNMLAAPEPGPAVDADEPVGTAAPGVTVSADVPASAPDVTVSAGVPASAPGVTVSGGEPVSALGVTAVAAVAEAVPHTTVDSAAGATAPPTAVAATASAAAETVPAADAAVSVPETVQVREPTASVAAPAAAETDAAAGNTGAATTGAANTEARNTGAGAAAHPPDPRQPPTGHRSVTVRASSAADRPLPVVERALRFSPGDAGIGWRDRLVVVPGGHRPGKPDHVQRDQARARLALPGPVRIVVLGSTAGAGQTVTALLTGQLLASLREEAVAVLDLGAGPGSVTELARQIPRLLPGRQPMARPGLAVQRAGGRDRALQVVTAEHTGSGPRDADRLIDAVCARYPLTIADPPAGDVPRALHAADQLVLVSPAGADSAGSLAMTMEWLEAHGHTRLVQASVTVLNGVSAQTATHAERAAAVAVGRCRAVVRVPWDVRLRVGGALGAETVRAFTALAGVLVSGLAESRSGDMAATDASSANHAPAGQVSR